MAKLSVGDTVSMTGEVTHIHDENGMVTIRLHGFATPITTRGEHLSLVARKRTGLGRRQPLFDKPD